MKTLAWVVLLSLPALADGLPPEIPLPPGTTTNAPTFSRLTFDQLEVREGAKAAFKRGERVRAYLSFAPEGAQQPAASLWKAWEPLLKAKGWASASTNDDWHCLKRGDQWLNVKLGDYQAPLVEAIVGPGAPTKLKLTPPGKVVEQVSDTHDWPFIGHFPGARLTGTGRSEVPFAVPGASEPTIVANGSVEKSYAPPPTLSRIETEVSYGEALTAAGWNVLPTEPGEGHVLAHFTKNGRNVWVDITRAADDSDQGLRISVADVGAEDWAKQLDAECRLSLVGVTFDFDRATLKADSAVVLEKAAAVIKARPALSLEVQGHTDNRGDDAYNLKLSDQRAQTVRSWLVSHGAPAAKLTAKGYGKNQPVADNDTDTGRAKNRRVDLRCQK